MIKKTAKSILRPILTPLRPGNIVMFHIGRCGSTALATMLRQHREMFWVSEYYESFFREWRKENEGEEIVGKMPDDAVELLKRSMGNALHRYYGFEIKPFHLRLIEYSMESYFEKLQELGFSHYIILDRKNRLRKIVSSVLAHSDRTKYHQDSKTGAKLKQAHIDVNSVKIDYDDKPLLSFLSDYDSQLSSLNKMIGDKNSLNLTYEEDIQEDPLIGYRRICDFVGLRPKDISARISRTNPFPVRDMIENFEEVENVLKGTSYEWMLYD